MVHGDSKQTPWVLVSYYRQKTESITYETTAAKNDIAPQPCYTYVVRDMITNELARLKT